MTTLLEYSSLVEIVLGAAFLDSITSVVSTEFALELDSHDTTVVITTPCGLVIVLVVRDWDATWLLGLVVLPNGWTMD